MSDVRRDLTSGTTTGSQSETELPQLTGSLAFTNGPAARALLEFARTSGFGSLEDLVLVGHNSGQEEFIDWIVKHYAQIPQLRDLTSMAGHDWRILNNFLVSNGFEPLFTEFDPNDLGICSIVEKTMLWTKAGTKATVYRRVDGKVQQYPGFKLSADTAQLQTLTGDDLFTERVMITTQGNETVYLAMLPENTEGPRDGAHLLRLVRQMLGARAHRAYDQAGVILPMINFDQVAEVDWLNGLGIDTPDGESSTLDSCRQHVRFQMNELGAKLEAAFAGVVSRGLAPQPFTVDRHFVLAVVDGTTSTTVLYLHPDDCWSEPPAGAIA
jgi:hypothetical protein